MRRPMFLLVLAALAISACNLLPQPKPVMTRRYKARTFINDTTNYADLTVFSLPVSGSAPNGVSSLAPEAQAEFVRAIAATDGANTPGAIAAGIASPLAPEASTPGTRNLAQVSRLVVYSIENRSKGPADRIHNARIITRPDPAATFVSWNQIATRHLKVNAGTLTFTQGNEIGGELGLKLPLLDAAPTLKGSVSNELVEEVTLEQRLVETSGALMPHEAVLVQQTASGLDLTGNVLAEYQFAVKDNHPEWFYSFRHEPSASCDDRPVIRGEFNSIADSPRDIQGNVVLEYVLRHVTYGDRTISEADDRVSFVTVRDSVRAILIPEDALRVPSWLVRTDAALDGALQLRSLVGGMDLERSMTVQFKSYEDAERMAIWLKRCKGEIPGFVATVRDGPVDLSRLYIDRVNANTDTTVVGPRDQRDAEDVRRAARARTR